jgi:glycerol-3-phosphate dehydrogenase
MVARPEAWDYAAGRTFDVLILGAGVNGACLYDRLCRQGYAVLLLDRSDFGGGTSQATGMMVWGGLLYLRNLDVATVVRLSRARDRMIRQEARWVEPCRLRYLPDATDGRSPALVWGALLAYWLLGQGRRPRPRAEDTFTEAALLTPGAHRRSLVFEEAMLRGSDARFVLSWITPHAPPSGAALNHCEAAGTYAATERLWHLELRDRLGDRHAETRARLVVNCAGPWTDDVNARFGIASPVRHVLSRGIYLGLRRRPEHCRPLIFDMGAHGDVLTYVPWGPIALWGPTEAWVTDMEDGATPTPEDVAFLLDRFPGHLGGPIARADVVAVRSGVRALAVDRSRERTGYPLDVSRGARVVLDPERPWISTYGGKLTGCEELAGAVAARIVRRLGPPRACPSAPPRPGPLDFEGSEFPGVPTTVPSPEWARDREACCTLEDYLRRRTNLAQWVPRQGLGWANEHMAVVEGIARRLCGGDAAAAEPMVREYAQNVERRFDRLLDRV